jgi:putative colanic acid biosynthesis UDP-glucose lipid carrier transferase
MITDRSKGIQPLVLLCQCILVTVGFWLWFFLFYYNQPIEWKVLSRQVVYNEFVLLGLIVGYWRSLVSLGIHRPTMEEAGSRSLGQLGGTLFCLLLYLVASRDERMSRVFFFTFIPPLYVLLFVTNRYLPALLGRIVFARDQKQRILLVGPYDKALRVKRWLDQSQHLGLEIVGLLTDDSPNLAGAAYGPSPHRVLKDDNFHPMQMDLRSVRDLSPVSRNAVASTAALTLTSPALFVHRAKFPRQQIGSSEPLTILGRIRDLEKYLSAPGLMNVVMVEFPRTNGSMREYSELCESRGVRLLVVADVDQIFGHSVTLFEDKGTFFLGLREEPLEDPINRFLKRCLDIAISLPVVVCVLPPLMLVVWIAQRLQSPGPLFFWQSREGFHNLSFQILKFRSMHVGDPNNETLPKSEDDPRLYHFGSFIRRTSLDEFPQFWNVLCGHMSVVGPRPHLPSYAREYRRVHFRAYVRNFVKPGITGLAQLTEIRGFVETSEQVMRRIESDIEYLENWSIWMDFWLILRTALQVVVPPKGAI